MGGKIYIPGSILEARPEIRAEITPFWPDRLPGSSQIRTGGFKTGVDREKISPSKPKSAAGTLRERNLI